MSDLSERKSAALKAFTAIGKKNGSAPPDSQSNTFATAYEFYIAEALRSVANARYDDAKARAIAEGVFASEYEPGTHIAYNADGLGIVAKRNNDSTTVDTTKLRVELLKLMTTDKVDALFAAATKPRKGNLVINASAE
jgi:hypothetical protein